MKKVYNSLFILALLLSNSLFSQDVFTVEIDPLVITEAPNVHSFSWGKTSDDKWVIIGGRIDGLHQRQPFAAFLENSNNKDITVIDIATNQTWSRSLQNITTSIFEQLQSTNQEFIQRDNTLYIIGGYGYSPTAGDHITYPNLTAIDLDEVANAVINNTDLNPYFRQISDPNLASTGGQLGLLDDVFYLCGGQFFEGRYNPMGPDHGPGFEQEYTDEIRKFNVVDDGTNLSLTNYSAVNDVDNLHRRDYNMAPQIFPNGEAGFTMFSGVFQQEVDLPFLNSVDITPNGHTVNNNFNQYLSQYHSAKIPIYDDANNTMHTIFFGGMSQYTLDENGNLVQDDNVPFVKTISKVTRSNSGAMTETKLEIEMPSLLGSGAEFIPITNTSFYTSEDILNINNLPEGPTLVGYIFGGIDSSQENIFFINNGTQSSASNVIFKVFINKGILGVNDIELNNESVYNLSVFPNPSKDIFTLNFFVPSTKAHIIEVNDLLGKLIKRVEIIEPIGNHSITIDLSSFASGEYFVTLKSEGSSTLKKIIKL
ncbi:MAG: T9SS type A sorting domain-containing protein [Flavobacteriaceae bacterium]|nr:T9SS type A sorting domain-containing protein [Flavobacteriaceae bacterium]